MKRIVQGVLSAFFALGLASNAYANRDSPSPQKKTAASVGKCKTVGNAKKNSNCPKDEKSKNKLAYTPWWTGPILASSGKVIDPGHINVEPYLFDSRYYGVYDNSWNFHSSPYRTSIISSVVVTAGLFDKVDAIFIPRAQYNKAMGHASGSLGDTTMGFGYQLVVGNDDSWVPFVRVIVQETLPTGKFQNLDLDIAGADATGSGGFQTTVGVYAQKIYALSNRHPLRLRFNATFTGSTSVDVNGPNVYGGGKDADATVYPGSIFDATFSAEYSITQNWVAAIDINYAHAGRTTFKGFPGLTPIGTLAPLGGPSSDQFSVAPAIEYNFNEHIGLLGGVWFSFAGRNSAAFAAPTIAVNMYY